jgi:hypothetical protein
METISRKLCDDCGADKGLPHRLHCRRHKKKRTKPADIQLRFDVPAMRNENNREK